MNMNVYTDPEPLAVDTIVDFQGFLARVSVLENEFRTLFRSFEKSLEDADEDKLFNADILNSYRQPSTYFIPQDESDRGLSCRLLNSSHTQWIDGRIHFCLALIYRQTPENDYHINPISYDNKTVIQIGQKTIAADVFLKPYLNDLKSREKVLSGDLREFLEKGKKNLIAPQTISECVDVEILQPGQGWISCKMDLHLTLRFYQAEIKNQAWQAIYCNSLETNIPQTDSLLQIGEYVTSIDAFCCSISRQFSLFEKTYKDNHEYYPDCPTLEQDIVSRLRMSSNFNLLRGERDDKGLPCKLLNLNSGHWLEGDLAFELLPQFIPDSASEVIKTDLKSTENYQSPLDDIRQNLLHESDSEASL